MFSFKQAAFHKVKPPHNTKLLCIRINNFNNDILMRSEKKNTNTVKTLEVKKNSNDQGCEDGPYYDECKIYDT